MIADAPTHVVLGDLVPGGQPRRLLRLPLAGAAVRAARGALGTLPPPRVGPGGGDILILGGFSFLVQDELNIYEASDIY